MYVKITKYLCGFKEFYLSCNTCLIVFLALGLISKLLTGSIKLSLTFQELVAALEESPCGGYCLTLELICHLYIL